MAKQVNGTEQSDLGISLDFMDIDEPMDTGLETAMIPEKTPETETEEDYFKTPEQVINKDEDIEDLDVNKFFESKNSEPLVSTTNSKVETDSKTEPKVTNTKEDKNKEISGSLTVAFAKTLLETQGISEFDEAKYAEVAKEKGEAAAFVELIENEVAKKTEAAKSSLDTYMQEYIKFRQNGFGAEEASILVGNKETIDAITDDQLKEDEELQENVVREVANIRGMSEEEIADDIKAFKDTDKLYDRAKKGKELLKDYYNKVAENKLQAEQQAKVKAAEEHIKFINSLKEDINKTDEILKGKKINQQTKDKVFDMITKPIKQADGTVLNSIWAKRRENQVDFDKKLAYLIHIGMFDNKTDSLIVDARTKAITDLQKNLEGNRKFTVGAPVVSTGTGALKEKIDAMDEFLT